MFFHFYEFNFFYSNYLTFTRILKVNVRSKTVSSRLKFHPCFADMKLSFRLYILFNLSAKNIRLSIVFEDLWEARVDTQSKCCFVERLDGHDLLCHGWKRPGSIARTIFTSLRTRSSNSAVSSPPQPKRNLSKPPLLSNVDFCIAAMPNEKERQNPFCSVFSVELLVSYWEKKTGKYALSEKSYAKFIWQILKKKWILQPPTHSVIRVGVYLILLFTPTHVLNRFENSA